MGRGVTLADLVEWRIGADRKKRKIKVSRIVERLGDYSSEFHDTKEQSRYKTVNRSASNADFMTKPIDAWCCLLVPHQELVATNHMTHSHHLWSSMATMPSTSNSPSPVMYVNMTELKNSFVVNC